jgi:hypothetical protein
MQIEENHLSLRWEEKLEILLNIIHNLEFIHDRNYVHKDLIMETYFNFTPTIRLIQKLLI